MSRMTCSKDGMSTERGLWVSPFLNQNRRRRDAAHCSLHRSFCRQFSSGDWHNNCVFRVDERQHPAPESSPVLAAPQRAFTIKMISVWDRPANSFGLPCCRFLDGFANCGGK